MAGTHMQAISPDLTGHGGRLDEAARLYPRAETPWLDLSTGINPHAWKRATPIDVDLRALPERTALRALEAAAARYFGVAPSRVAAVPGSEIALRLLPALGLPPIASVAPSYATHGHVAAYSMDSAAPLAGCTLLLANPNNPDGRLIAPEALRDLGERQAATAGWLVVDEAYADAVPGSSLLPHLGADDPVIVLRSFGKFFGLAGLRLGFVIAPEAVLAQLRHLLGDWPVSSHAIACGRAAYADRNWITTTLAALPSRAARLDALLERHDLNATGTCPLFRLVETPEAKTLFGRLAHAGILVRPFADRPNWLRFGVPADDAAFARLDRALLTRG